MNSELNPAATNLSLKLRPFKPEVQQLGFLDLKGRGENERDTFTNQIAEFSLSTR